MKRATMTPLLCACLAVFAGAGEAHAAWSPIATGIDHDTFVRDGARVHALRINLCAPGVSMRATAPGEGPRTTGSWGELAGVTAAINGDWWARDGVNPNLPQTTFPRGLAVGLGEHFPGTVDPNYYGFFAFGINRALHSIQEEAFGGPAPWMESVVSGQPTLLWNGQLRDNPAAHCGVNRARTSVGISADNSTLYWAVVEEVGGSAGMTCNEMASLMQSLGAHSALNQDGGGSSTMWTKASGTLNNPSDGSPRSLVTHWGVFAANDGPPRSCSTRNIPPYDNGVRRLVGDSTPWGFALIDLILLPDDVIAMWPEGRPWPAERRLVSVDGDPAIYLEDDGLRRHVPNPYAMNTWRFSSGTVDSIAAAERDALEDAAAIPDTPILVVDSEFRVWVIDYPADRAVVPGEPDAGPGGSGGDAGPGGPGGGSDSNGGGSANGEPMSGGCQIGSPVDEGAQWWCLAVALLAWRRRQKPRPTPSPSTR